MEMSEKLSHLEETRNRTAAPEHRKGSVEVVQALGQDVTTHQAGVPNWEQSSGKGPGQGGENENKRDILITILI